ncbi:hypothetical protein [Pseudodesulfovibrio piezophilus]|uniref:Uncharacterized protein n=1 Tax=Pseudodesulfovibrio piezophilus (strain DSM 21447 / JCM 15486 / C1TLV30) TaxID=1322246 RepID=M1WMQ6_PSEP2|nr:hypothetical protein [Pseudodesulfovibrio piezophilus]CCH49885.1 conserved protein of unknown function [Pseudodesulfovibrio piezophilus C1TLV30]
MSIFSGLVPASRKAEKNFTRARAAEMRNSSDQARKYFAIAAQAFDALRAAKESQRQGLRPSHLVMAGICYTRLGRDKDALLVLDTCLEHKEIPDAYLHAGYAAAHLNKMDMAAEYWAHYPLWAEQPHMAATLKKLVADIHRGNTSKEAICQAVVTAVHEQDRLNMQAQSFATEGTTIPRHRGY